MPGGFSSTNITSDTIGNASNLHTMSSRKTFPCNTCELVFEDSRSQRTHMRGSWHVYNLKRRMASLPHISAATYEEKIARKLNVSQRESADTASHSKLAKPYSGEERAEHDQIVESTVNETASENCCLFCTKYLDGPEANVKHMSSEHGLYIPEIEYLTSLEIMIGYLHTVIIEYNECLYCGTIKQSADGVRRHMLDKGHCMINLEREPELLEFWDLSESDEDDLDKETDPAIRPHRIEILALKDSSQDEHVLPSGKVIESRRKAREARLLTRRIALAARNSSSQRTIDDSSHDTGAASSTNPTSSMIATRSEGNPQDRIIAVRNAAGLLGVSDQQLRSLLIVERKTQRQEAMVRASASWADELGGTHQKHYKQKMRLRDG